MLRATLLATTLTGLAAAHTAAWAKGMYCRGGPDPSNDNPNTNTAVNPLYNLPQEQWWFQHDRGCDAVPPPAGEFLELPANGQFTVELAHNRAFTTLSYDGKETSDWPDGQDHPDDWNAWEGPGSSCLDDGALHTFNETNAAGTAWAISYESDIKLVTLENLVVFSTLQHTPWKRLATYDVPSLPACPEGGCHCAWLWVPDGCGQPNMYMQPYKCTVTNASSTVSPADVKAQAPVYCADDESKCVRGPKQMIAWNQLSGNNVSPPDFVSPGYNAKFGFKTGAQADAF